LAGESFADWLYDWSHDNFDDWIESFIQILAPRFLANSLMVQVRPSEPPG
jgi:hypothetical protein